MDEHGSTTQTLLDRTQHGDSAARAELLARHRDRLKRMVRIRLDSRLAPRVDPSDVIQETLLEAHEKLKDYLERRHLPFYVWLRQMAWDRVIGLHRHHVHAKKRSVLREAADSIALPDRSAVRLARQLATSANGPSKVAVRRELAERVREALAELPEIDREILVLRQLEHLSVAEVAAVLNISEGAVKLRRFRALERLRGKLDALRGDF